MIPAEGEDGKMNLDRVPKPNLDRETSGGIHFKHRSMLRKTYGRGFMASLKVSPKFQVVIPKQIRDEVRLKSGEEIIMLTKNGVIFIYPDTPLEKLRGSLRGISLKGIRDKKDRLP